MLKTLEKLYEGADLSAPAAGVMYFRLTEDCTIKEISIYADSPVSADAVFNCSLNSTNLFSVGTRPKILSGNESVTKSGLSIDASKGDKFVLSLDSLTGTIDAPLVLLLTVDDGLTVEASGGGGNVYSIDAESSSDVTPESDYFGDEEKSLARWTPFQPDQHKLVFDDGRAKFIIPRTVGIVTGMFQALPPGDCTIITKCSTDAPELNYCTIGLGLFQDAANNPNSSDIIGFNLCRNTARATGSGSGIDIETFSDKASFTAVVGSQINLTDDEASADVYLRAVRTGSTWTFSFSKNGRSWTDYVTTISEGAYFNPKEFGPIVVYTTTGTPTSCFEYEFFYYKGIAGAVLPGGSLSGASPSVVDKRMIVLGTSIEEGYGLNPLQAWPEQLATLLDGVSVSPKGLILQNDDGAKEWKIINDGADAYTAQNIIDTRLPSVIRRRDAGLSRDIVLIGALTNDLSLGDSGATVYAKAASMISDLQAEGFEVWIQTVIDRDTVNVGGFDARRSDYNTLVSANTAGADVVIDLAANAHLSDASNTTYFQGDGVHTSKAGNAEIAADVFAEI